MAIPNQTCVAGRAILRWWEAGRAFPLFVKINVYGTPFVATDGEGGHVAPVEQKQSCNSIAFKYQYNSYNICGITVGVPVHDKLTLDMYKALAEGRHLHFLTEEINFRCAVNRLLRRWLVVASFAVGKVAKVTELFCGLGSDSPMNRFSVAALARLHPICARHKRNIPLELYSTVGGTGWSRPDESVFYPAKSPQYLINALTGQVAHASPDVPLGKRQPVEVRKGYPSPFLAPALSYPDPLC
jgi:hypothetical protein